MKKLCLFVLCLIFSPFLFANGPGDDKLKKDSGKQNIERIEQSPDFPGSIRIGFGLSSLRNAPDDLNTVWIRSRSVDIYYIADINIGNSRFVFNPGLGLGLEKLGFARDITLTRTETGTEITPVTNVQVNRSLLAANYVDIPLEIRYHVNKLNPYQGFNIAVGGRIGVLYSAHTKLDFEDMGTSVVNKRKEHYNLNRFRYGLTGRIGIGRFNVYYYQNLSTFFRDNRAPEGAQDATHYKIGISFAAF